MLIGALPLGTVAGIALGAVVWMHTHAALARTGAVEYLPTVLAAAVLLELAPIGAGLIVAARTGASLGAELGAMKLGEQLDALELLGLPPMRVLVGPRVLACVLALPLLHVYIAALALFSGYVAENMVGHTNWLKFQTASLKELYPQDVIRPARDRHTRPRSDPAVPSTRQTIFTPVGRCQHPGPEDVCWRTGHSARDDSSGLTRLA